MPPGFISLMVDTIQNLAAVRSPKIHINEEMLRRSGVKLSTVVLTQYSLTFLTSRPFGDK